MNSVFKVTSHHNFLNFGRLFVVSQLPFSQRVQVSSVFASKAPEVLIERKLEKHGIVVQSYNRNVHLPSVRVVRNKIENAFNYIFFTKLNDYKRYGLNWYRSLDQVNYKDFFYILDLPDTFFSWFKVNELHIWMILARLMNTSKELRHVRTSLLEAMWVDVEKRAKSIDAFNKNYKSDLRILEERLKISLFMYDEGYLNGDAVFANILWEHFFERNCTDPRLLEVLISFIRHQLNLLPSVRELDQDLREEKLPPVWTSLQPHYNKIFF